MANRLNAAIYWVAIALFLTGTTLLLIGATAHLETLETPGAILNVLGWTIAAVGAVVDVIRHRRHRQPD